MEEEIMMKGERRSLEQKSRDKGEEKSREEERVLRVRGEYKRDGKKRKVIKLRKRRKQVKKKSRAEQRME